MKDIDRGFSPDKGTVCALGLFDGVHRGHRLVINNALSLAAELGVRSAVFTFRTDTVTSKGHDGRIEMILSDEEKRRHFENMGVDLIYSPAFHELKGMSAEEFVKDILVGLLGCKAVVCGSDFRFGKGAERRTAKTEILHQQHDIAVRCRGQIEFDSVRPGIRLVKRDGKAVREERLDHRVTAVGRQIRPPSPLRAQEVGKNAVQCRSAA